MENEKKSSMFDSFSKMISEKRKKAIKSKEMDDRDEERSKSEFYKPLSESEKKERMEGIMERRAQKDKSEGDTKKARKRNMLEKWLKQ